MLEEFAAGQDQARELILGQISRARDLLIRGEANGAVAILQTLLGSDAQIQVPAPTSKTLDLNTFFSAFATACRKNGVADAAYVVFVPIGNGEARRIVGGTEGAAKWVADALSEASTSRRELLNTLRELSGPDLAPGSAKADLKDYIKEALVAPDPESHKLAALTYLVVQDRSKEGALDLVVADTPDINVAMQIVNIIRSAGSDARVVRKLIGGV